MSVNKVVILLSALGVLADSGACQTFVGADFEQLAAPSGCIRNATIPPTNIPMIPALKLPGVTFSGGQVVSYANPFQSYNNVYFTDNGCAGVQPAITITFEGPASNVSMVVGNYWSGGESIQVQDDQGDNLTVFLAPNPVGQSLFIPSSNIRQITLSLPGSIWTQGSPAGFYIDNLQGHINNQLEFVDPVPLLMTGSDVVSDVESLATLGTLVRAVAADGLARIVLTIQAAQVGQIFTLTILNDRGVPSNSVQEDGGIAAVGSSPAFRQQSVRITAQDSGIGPRAFAVYYPPPDFSRGLQDDQVGSRNIQIQVDPQGVTPPTYSRTLTILRPPVVLLHDLWEEAASWDTLTPLVNDVRFFIRRASYNGVLGNRITASIPVFQNGKLAHARESALGLGYTSPLVLTQIAQYLNEFRSVQNAAAAQADVVVHGMGGVIARAAVQLPNYNAPESFSLGNINKLITIGTPHLGTPFASALLKNDNTCVREILASAGKFSFASATVDGGNVSGGIGDLQGNGFGGGLSPALAKIQQSGGDTAPVGLIAGVMTNGNTNNLDSVTGMAAFIRQACGGSMAAHLTASGWDNVAGDASDAMVPLTSQVAGMFAIPVFGMVHSTGMEELGFSSPSELDAQSVNAAVTILLNASARSFSFHPLP